MRDSFVLSVMDESWGEVFDAIRQSERLLEATLAMDEAKVADRVFLPKHASGKPALVVELKWNRSAEGAIQQIRDRRYVDALRNFKGNILLVGINYDRESKQHECRIEVCNFTTGD